MATYRPNYTPGGPGTVQPTVPQPVQAPQQYQYYGQRPFTPQPQAPVNNVTGNNWVSNTGGQPQPTGNQQFPGGRVGQYPGQQQPAGQYVPPTGLIGDQQARLAGLGGAESALYGGLQGGLGMLQQGMQGGYGMLQRGMAQGRGDIMSMVSRGAGPLQQFVPAGQQSQQLQAALSGALGPEAQAQAFQNYKDSPGQDWLQSQGERAVTRNAAALGGLGGGNVMQELQRQGQGLAQQDFQNQWGRLNDLSGQGLDAAGMLGSLYGNAAGQLGNIGLQGGIAGSNLGLQGGIAGANLYQGTGQDIASARFRTGQDLGDARTRAGQDIAGNIAGTTSALADLADSQGRGFSDLIGQGGSNLAELLKGWGSEQGGSYEALAALLANLRMTGTGQAGGLPGLGGVSQTGGSLGGIGDLASGLGTAYMAYQGG